MASSRRVRDRIANMVLARKEASTDTEPAAISFLSPEAKATAAAAYHLLNKVTGCFTIGSCEWRRMHDIMSLE